MIKSIKISGYKSLQDSEVNFSTPLTAIVGRNNVGKSNLFDALKLLSGIPEARTIQSLFNLDKHRGTFLESFSSKDEPIVNLEIELDLAGAKHPLQAVTNASSNKDMLDTNLTYQVEFKIIDGKIFVTDETLRTKVNTLASYFARPIRIFEQEAENSEYKTPTLGVEIIPTRDRIEKVDRLLVESPRTVSAISLVNDADSFPQVVTFKRELASWRFYHFEPTALRKESYSIELAEMGSDGTGLSGVFRNLKDNHPDLFEYAEEAMRMALPEFKHITFRDLSDGIYLLALEDKEGQTFTARVLSDGVLRFLAMIAFAYAPTSPGLICLEEPENGVHPNQLSFILEMLRAATRGETASGTTPQILITSHSPYLVDKLEPEELILAEKDEENKRTIFYSVGDIVERKKVVKRHLETGVQNLGELWAQGSLSVDNVRRVKFGVEA